MRVFTNEDPKKAPPYVGRYLLIEACDWHNRSREVWIQWVVGGTAINVQRIIVVIEKKINSSFSTSFHMKEISGMYLNIFDVFQGAKARDLFAAVTFPSPTTKQSTMVSALLINILCTIY
jgi:hypothetical protein